jgi:hypothetical protein
MLLPIRALVAAITALLGGGAGSLVVANGSLPGLGHHRHRPAHHVMTQPSSTSTVPMAGTTTGSTTTNSTPTTLPTGSASFFIASDGNLAVQLRLSGLVAGSVHSIDVEAGGCPSTFRLDQSVIGGNTVTADGNGMVNQTIDTGRAVSTLPNEPLAFAVRQGVARNIGDGGQNAVASAAVFCASVPMNLAHGTTSMTTTTTTPTTNTTPTTTTIPTTTPSMTNTTTVSPPTSTAATTTTSQSTQTMTPTTSTQGSPVPFSGTHS